MSAKQDLVEAHAFNRRRLVTAFLSGAPGGREVEPIRYGRALVGGAVLAVLAVAGAAVGGFLNQPVPDGWDDNTLVVVEETGARFLAQHLEETDETRLFPVINTTSARLLLADEAGEFQIESVPREQVRDAVLGPTIGIAGAPDTVPESDDLVQSGWTACTNEQGGIKVTVADSPGTSSATDQSVVVADSAGDRYVVTGSARFPVRRGDDTVLRSLGQEAGGLRVPGQWLNLMPLGPTLEPFSVPGQGEPVDTGVAGLSRVGTPVRTDRDTFLLVRDDAGEPGLLPVPEVAYAVYRSGGPGARQDELEADAGDLAGIPTVEASGDLSFLDEWPEAVPTPIATTTPCLQLQELEGTDELTSRLVVARSVEAGLVPLADAVERQVEPGHGAVVRERTEGTRFNGASVLIDSSGTRYALGEGGNDFRGQLGYADVEPPVVASAWTGLFADGPTLSSQAASQAATSS